MRSREIDMGNGYAVVIDGYNVVAEGLKVSTAIAVAKTLGLKYPGRPVDVIAVGFNEEEEHG